MPRHLPLPKGNEKIWRELLPPTSALQKLGRHVYVFRNTQTNQIVYSLYPVIEQRHLKQLPFIGKHSVPPRIRPDKWTAHCRVGPFPTGTQGKDFLRKLRELRRLHETTWNKTNPEWKKEPKKNLIKLIMDQRGNTTIDIATVLEIHNKMRTEQQEEKEWQAQKQEKFLEGKWEKLRHLAKLGNEGKIPDLESQIKEAEAQKEKVANDAVEERRLRRQIKEDRLQIRRIQSAMQLVKRIDNAPSQTLKDRIYRSILPDQLRTLPEVFSLEGVEIHWADREDEIYQCNWPVEVQHAFIPKPEILTEEEFAFRASQERQLIEEEALKRVEEILLNEENERRAAQGLPPLERLAQPQPTTPPVLQEEVTVEASKPGLIARFTSMFKRA
ncbi:uncharacterized protein EI97DRAFT_504158 [Westerdykella ornata]|uniref:Large ribosomal subunit protein mL67 n=1 Tax=Westerdykella ornata TaxID=318751 RepID=A0A6A6J8B6_WESOR|nr:uncharacterized protein EI97DRAFT_504158 [Westerdykella ornata]KAF2272487.1 hypothetical protein EI97DRAFT_504158 [Westerdykella ornata]